MLTKRTKTKKNDIMYNGSPKYKVHNMKERKKNKCYKNVDKGDEGRSHERRTGKE